MIGKQLNQEDYMKVHCLMLETTFGKYFKIILIIKY